MIYLLAIITGTTLISIVVQIIFFKKLKKTIKMTAQETLEVFVTELQAARDAIIERLNSIIAGGGDLTAQEVTDLLTPIVTDLQNIGNPPE